MLFRQIIQLRDELSQLSMSRNEFCAAMADSSINLATQSQQIQNIAVDFDASEQVYIIDDNSQPHFTPIIIDREDMINHLSDVISGTSMTIGDLFQSWSNTGDNYAILSIISQKFSYCERVRLSDINDIIDNNTSQLSLNYDINSLKQHLLSVTNNDGYITSRSWLSTLSAWMKSCKDGADSSSPELDETAPNTLSSLYNIATTIATTVVTTILAGIATAFNAIYGLIIITIGQLFSSIANYMSDQIDLNQDSPNSYARGVIISQIITNANSDSSKFNWLWNQCKDDYSIRCLESEVCDLYFWKGDNLGDIKVNAYYRPKYTPEEVANYVTILVNAGILTIYDTQYGKALRKDDEVSIRPSEMSDQDAIKITTNGDYWAACMAATELVRWITSVTHLNHYDSGGTSRSSCIVQNSTFNETMLMGLLRSGWKCVYDIILNGSPTEAWSYWGCIYYCKETLKMYYDNRSVSLDDPCLAISGEQISYGNPLVVTDTSPFSISEINGLRAQYTVSPSTTSQSATVSEIVHYYDYLSVDCLPISFLITFKAWDSTNIITNLVIVSLASIAAAFVYLKVSKAIRIKKIEKRTIRSQRIAALRAAWEADPGNKTLLHEYAKEVDKYNRLGRILGWGTYDAANGWIDTANGGSNVANPNTGVMDSIDRLKNVSQKLIDMSSASAQESIDIRDYIDNKISQLYDDISEFISRNVVDLIK